MTISTSKSFEIQQGAATPAESELILLGTKQDGDPDALRVLTHPDAQNWPSISYQRNPDRTSNLDNDVLYPPKAQLVETAGTTGVLRWERYEHDAICRERWDGGERKASVETWFFRKLYEYLMNPPPLSTSNQTYIMWQPRDRNSYTYNVVLMQLIVGSAQGEMWVIDLVPPQGDIGGGMQDSDVPGSGVLLAMMELTLKIVGKVT